MKKLLIILILILCATWLLILPGLVGLGLQQQLDYWQTEQADSPAWTLERGWFASRLAVEWPDQAPLSIKARHLPPTGGNWLRFGGEAPSIAGLRDVVLDGRIDWNGQSQATLTALSTAWEGSISASSGASALQLEVTPGQQFYLSMGLADLIIDGRDTAKLTAGLGQASIDWRVADTFGHLQLNLRLQSVEPVESALALQVSLSSIDPAALSLLAEGIDQLRQAPPESMAERLAWLNLLAAWHQLNQAGLLVEVDEARLGESITFMGRWPAGQSPVELSGHGRLDGLLLGLAPYVALVGQMPLETAEQQVMQWVYQATLDGWLHSDGDTFAFRYDGSALPGELFEPVNEGSSSN